MVPMWCSFSRWCWCVGEIRRSGCPCIPGQVTRFGGCPSAALASSTCAGPPNTYAAPTAMTAPVTAAMAGSWRRRDRVLDLVREVADDAIGGELVELFDHV